MLRAALVSLLLAAAAPAVAACPEWLVADMAERGVAGFEIDRMCGQAPSRSLAPPAAAPPAAAPGPPPASRSLGLFSAAPQAPRARPGSTRCVPEAGPACTTPSLRPLGSPCWCADGKEAREGTIR